ncbi:hypothetical protein C8R45DRAFT_1179808 [Mycena sanguinolenta]|nr:hypothetical protein C8R45DRAFT_1179808 [Mycena sanguinolenta]
MVMTSPELFHDLSDLAFPQLILAAIPLSSNSYSFLHRNPTLEFITVIPVKGSESLSNKFSDIQPIHMPQLRQFEGPESAVCTVVPGSPVSMLTIWWGRPDPVMSYSRGLTAAASSKADLHYLVNSIIFWDPALLRAIAMHTPRIQILEIRNLTQSGARGKADFLPAFEDTLHSLICLKNLIISDKSSCHLDRIGDVLESEFDRVRRWGKICPTLVCVRLSGEEATWACWDDIWIPASCGTDHPESVECLRWFIKKVLITPELPSLYLAMAMHFGAVDGILVLEEAVRRGEAMPAFDILRKEGGRTYISFPSDLYDPGRQYVTERKLPNFCGWVATAAIKATRLSGLSSQISVAPVDQTTGMRAMPCAMFVESVISPMMLLTTPTFGFNSPARHLGTTRAPKKIIERDKPRRPVNKTETPERRIIGLPPPTHQRRRELTYDEARIITNPFLVTASDGKFANQLQELQIP